MFNAPGGQGALDLPGEEVPPNGSSPDYAHLRAPVAVVDWFLSHQRKLTDALNQRKAICFREQDRRHYHLFYLLLNTEYILEIFFGQDSLCGKRQLLIKTAKLC